MTSAASSHAATRASCWSKRVVTGEESESGSSGHSGRNLQRTASAASDAAAAKNDRSRSARPHSNTTTAAPPLRKGARGRDRLAAERPYRRRSAAPNTAARTRPRTSACAARPPRPRTRRSASLTSPIPNEAGQARLRPSISATTARPPSRLLRANRLGDEQHRAGNRRGNDDPVRDAMLGEVDGDDGAERDPEDREARELGAIGVQCECPPPEERARPRSLLRSPLPVSWRARLRGRLRLHGQRGQPDEAKEHGRNLAFDLDADRCGSSRSPALAAPARSRARRARSPAPRSDRGRAGRRGARRGRAPGFRRGRPRRRARRARGAR